MNQLDNYNNNPFTQSEYYKNKKQLNKMMKDYQIFVKKYIGDATPISSITEERMNKLLNEENYRNKNVFLDEEYNNEFQQILKNNKDLDFGEEIISMELPSDDEFSYSEIDKLGNNKNNINDYKRRARVLFKNQIDEEERERQRKIKEEKERQRKIEEEKEKEKERQKKIEEEKRKKKLEEEEKERKRKIEIEEENERLLEEKKAQERQKEIEEEEKRKKEEEEKRKKEEEEKRKKEIEEKRKKEEEEKRKKEEEEKRKKEEEKRMIQKMK